ncbi:MAG: DUF2299 family protein [Gammaproteobacteria bacterium]|nr:DUF2299 family protein [Gammaproteobacteria bacterium]
MHDKIVGWVEELGLDHTDLVVDDWAWGVVVTSDDGKAPVFVGQLDDDLEQVLLLAAVQASETHFAAFQELDAQAQKEFITKLRLRLSDLPVDISLDTGEDETEPRPMMFHAITRLLDENITRAKLYEAYTRMRRTCSKIRLILDTLTPSG